MKNNNTFHTSTIYAVDAQAPEMNYVERIYRARDQRIERGELLDMIFTEEEHKKHMRDGTLITERSHPYYVHPTQETPNKHEVARPRNDHLPLNTNSKKAH